MGHRRTSGGVRPRGGPGRSVSDCGGPGPGRLRGAPRRVETPRVAGAGTLGAAERSRPAGEGFPGDRRRGRPCALLPAEGVRRLDGRPQQVRRRRVRGTVCSLGGRFDPESRSSVFAYRHWAAGRTPPKSDCVAPAVGAVRESAVRKGSSGDLPVADSPGMNSAVGIGRVSRPREIDMDGAPLSGRDFSATWAK
jgi:hypothetical protein